MTGTNCDLFTHKSSRSYLNHLVVDAFRNFANAPKNWEITKLVSSSPSGCPIVIAHNQCNLRNLVWVVF